MLHHQLIIARHFTLRFKKAYILTLQCSCSWLYEKGIR